MELVQQLSFGFSYLAADESETEKAGVFGKFLPTSLHAMEKDVNRVKSIGCQHNSEKTWRV